MNEPLRPSTDFPSVLRVKASEDRFGEQRGLGISVSGRMLAMRAAGS